MKQATLGDNPVVELRPRIIRKCHRTSAGEKIFQEMNLQQVVQENNEDTCKP